MEESFCGVALPASSHPEIDAERKRYRQRLQGTCAARFEMTAVGRSQLHNCQGSRGALESALLNLVPHGLLHAQRYD
jgi:hypothetical protein